MKVVIIGGVAGGATAAARIRRLDEHAQIVVFERSGFVSYANCGLPYYVGGVIERQDDLTLQTPESFWRRFRINVHVRHEVTSIDAAAKCVTVRDLNSGRVFQESYDKLLLSTGAKPIQPPIPGIDSDRVFSLRTIEDAVHLRQFMTTKRPRRAVLVGGGFIGLEMAENLMAEGVEVTIVQNAKQLMNTLDIDMASLVHTHLRQKGVTLLLETEVVGFETIQDSVRVLFKNRAPLMADMVLVAVGVCPDSSLAKTAGLRLGMRNSVVVNERMETSVPDIYAVGDAVEICHAVSGQKTVIALAGPANKQGRIAADNICGGNSNYRGALGSSIIQVFDLTVASTGLNEKTARQADIDFDRVVLSPASHASYYPGAKVMTMKVIFEKKTLRILGAQIIGEEGVDKRLDVIATAMGAGIQADALKNLDLSYAPPYSSAKDPVNMAGFVIDNLATARVKQFHWDEVDALPRDGSVTLLDARTPGEYAMGHVEGFINIPVDELRERLGEIDRTKPVYVMCQSGLRSYVASRILTQEGFDCFNFSGGYRFYAAVTREVVGAIQAHPCGMEKH